MWYDWSPKLFSDSLESNWSANTKKISHRRDGEFEMHPVFCKKDHNTI